MSLIFQSLLTPCLVSNRAEETGFSVDFLPVFCTFHYHTFSSGLLMAPFAQLATSVRGTFFYSLHHWPPPPFSNITWLFHTAFCYVSKITQLSQRFLLNYFGLLDGPLWPVGLCPAAWLQALFQHRHWKHLFPLSGCWFSYNLLELIYLLESGYFVKSMATDRQTDRILKVAGQKHRKQH